jgi:superfamily I DNA and/or RNA helicase
MPTAVTTEDRSVRFVETTVRFNIAFTRARKKLVVVANAGIRGRG